MTESTPAIVFAELAARRASLLARSVADLFAANPARYDRFHVFLGDLLYDFSKQRINSETLRLLLTLAEAADVAGKRDAMFRGELVNSTERRAALHSALRDRSGAPVLVDGVDVAPTIKAERDKMLAFAADVREGRVRGAHGQPMTNVVNIGIGGSDLGPAMAARALAPFARPGLHCHFVSNVDGADIADTLHGLEPARTLFIVSSKTFTTQETMTNAHTARAWIVAALGEGSVADHFAAVSTRLDKVAEFGVEAGRVFGFWDWVGGRYSIWSSIGLPLAIAIGPEHYLEFLSGGAEVDGHFREAPPERNIPLLMGLSACGIATCSATHRKPSFPTTSAWRAFPPIFSSCRWRATARACAATERRPSARRGRSSGASRAPTASTRSSNCCTRAPRSRRSTSSPPPIRPMPTRIITTCCSPIALPRAKR